MRMIKRDVALKEIDWSTKWQVHLFIVCVYAAGVVAGHIRYSVPEEMVAGSFVGNIANDLGIDIKRLINGRGRIFTGGSTQYIELNTDKGTLVVKEKIDRESLCGQVSPCSFSFEVILDNPMELHRVTVEVQDINDNAPHFPKNEITLEMSESALPGARLFLDRAVDPDVGVNSVQSYSLKPTDNFVLKLHSLPDGSTAVDMMLETPLDREKADEHYLILTALDSGSPQRSGTVNIHIVVLDANDNAPVFTQPVYKATVTENSPHGTLVTAVKAIDTDEGSNAQITYSLTQITDQVNELFEINPHSGEIEVVGQIDFEKSKVYQITVQAKDYGGFTDSCKVLIEIIDINDNVPTIIMMSFSSPVREDAKPGTVIAMINIQDVDSGENGEVRCSIHQDVPFTLKSSLTNYYSLVTEGILDREEVSEYNITITATDKGTPPLSSSQVLTVKISDVNDNAPVFENKPYNAHVMENNSPGLSIFTVKASDSDWNQNARVSYSLSGTEINGTPVSAYISVNSDTGVIYAVRSLDFEFIKHFTINVRAQDGGSPPLTSNITLNIIIEDQNDNSPQILYPVQSGVSLVAEMVARSADVGYLVTKVVAVDADSGQNAWLSYKLLKATDRALFEVGSQNGEIRTSRQVSDKDAVKQRLVVVVEDNGQPSRSATVNVNVAVADSFPEVLSEFSDFTHDKDYNDSLTFYLVLSLAVVSFLFIVSVIVLVSVKVYRWRQSRLFYKSNGNLPVIPSAYYPPLYADVGATGTLQHVYNYEVCMTTDSGKSEYRYIRPVSQNLVSVDTETMPHMDKKNPLEKTDQSAEQKPANTDWRFSQGQRPGPSGAPQRPEEAGPWPNPPTEAEQLQALMAAANEVSEATNTLGGSSTLGPGTMGLSTRYSPQFTLQHVPDYRQNIYIPGSTATLTGNNGQGQGPPQGQPQALPQPQPQQQPPQQPPAEAPKPAQTPANKKKSAKKDKK
ncbi:protocadherin gamma-A11 isoform X13 [Amia ocellicauda]|uniref:protocadherin gamma-A11 isoform X13 n=1 Tax=Amia ocellicauda TaxID=2972642 RepID=UPI0034648600